MCLDNARVYGFMLSDKLDFNSSGIMPSFGKFNRIWKQESGSGRPLCDMVDGSTLVKSFRSLASLLPAKVFITCLRVSNALCCIKGEGLWIDYITCKLT